MNISIAMCTYNGEKYLKEQLHSLEEQTLIPFEVVIVDDCSKDGTRKILKDFKKTSKLNILLFYNEKNLGVVKAFEKAISLCEGDYISLCDQDDIWLPEKLELFFKKMKESEEKYGKGTPLIVYSDLKMVDKDLNIISPSRFKYYGMKQLEGNPLNSIFLQNIVTGCASMFNIPLKNISLPFSKNVFVHDWWLALKACGFGKIIPISEPSILYRLHEKNLIGKTKGNFLKRIKKIFTVAPENLHLNKIFLQANEFIKVSKELGTNFFELESIINILDKGGASSIFFSFRKKILPKSFFYRLRFFQTLYFRSKSRFLK